MSVEAMARIAGKGLSLDHIPGGIPKLSMEELMGCLAGLDRGPELLIRAAVAGQRDQGLMDDLYREGLLLAGKMAVRNGWRAVKGKPVLRGCAGLAIDELVYPGAYMCPLCNGTGLVADQAGNGGRVQCPGCGGSRTVPASGRRCADRCGIDEKAWRVHWKDRFLQVRAGIVGWYWDGVAHVNYQLRGEAS